MIKIIHLMLLVIIFLSGFSLINISQEPFSISAKEIDSPYNRVNEDQVEIYNNKVIINIKNPEYARFTNTNSMDPLLDETANAIEIIPKSEEDIHPGDVVSYKSKVVNSVIIHRIIKISKDEKGTYYTLKGDNNNMPDPEKVRFNQIERVVVAIIY